MGVPSFWPGWGRRASHSFVSFYHEPHSTDIAFCHHRRRESFTQINNQISATMFDLVKLVINYKSRLEIDDANRHAPKSMFQRGPMSNFRCARATGCHAAPAAVGDDAALKACPSVRKFS
ncbi:hypothetical protein EVAR_56893_1 [Eumeta japonica]|uniref:Uncharacterized protein n=1 Tax=Eumeta variegata TaxID=151549 RepID=A0A4C1ZIV0_EUMVA|nr:hypothetical protein EVAR_56893_1 [Eumeta japonica]